MNTTSILTYKTFLETAFDNGDYQTDDIIAFILPILKEVLEFHEEGKVGSFDNQESLFITNQALDIDENQIRDKQSNLSAFKSFFKLKGSKGLEVIEEIKVKTEVGYNISEESLHIQTDLKEKPKHPAYLPSYQCYEMLLGHHDELTDIFCLGLILGSMSMGLNLYNEEDLKTFVEYRNNPVGYYSRIHPTISGLITEMTALNRANRSRDLYTIIDRLEHYRDFDPEKQIDLSELVTENVKERDTLILEKLRNRLFDFSKRNRLIYYKPNMRFVNLSIGSVPNVLHYQSINPASIFSWNDDIAQKVIKMNQISLNKYLRFEDHNYLNASITKIRAEANKDIKEFGFSQLKMVISFLHWHNLKENKNERIMSPLLMIPIQIVKKKSLNRDQFTIKILDNQAEVNPVLAQYLRELYGIKLPAFLDLYETPPEKFYQLLKQQIEATKSGVQLNYLDKPKIRLIHSVAKNTITNYRRRLRKRGNLNLFNNLSYSYNSSNYKPLGLEIFKQQVEPKTSFLEFLVNEDIGHSPQNLTGVKETKRELYQIANSEANPYSWDFDVCNIVAGNFNYKKMSLVRDYNQVIDEDIKHQIFNDLFSNAPKELKVEEQNSTNEDWYHVVQADPTQSKAVLKSHGDESYIIQGPPGTGKSQTITNLIADFIARGKSILFVCEKRAALDVVYHRLKQQKLNELCCYIHDSQTDKKEFIQNLKVTYEDFLANRLNLEKITQLRSDLFNKVNEGLEQLKAFHTLSNAENEPAGKPIRKLIERLTSVKEHIADLSIKEKEYLPFYNQWANFGETINSLGLTLEETGNDEIFAEHPFSKINEAIISSEHPVNELDKALQQIKQLLSPLEEKLNAINLSSEFTNNFSNLTKLFKAVKALKPLADSNGLDILNSSSSKAYDFDKGISQIEKLLEHYESSQEKNKHWTNKFSPNITNEYLEIAKQKESSFFKFLSGNWRRVKKEVQASFDFSSYATKPTITQTLQLLKEEQDAFKAIDNEKEAFSNQFKILDIDTTKENVQHFRGRIQDAEVAYLLGSNDATKIINALDSESNKFNELSNLLSKTLVLEDAVSLSNIKDVSEGIEINIDNLYELLPALRSFSKLPTEIKNSIRNIAITPNQMEANIAAKTLENFYLENRRYAATDFVTIEDISKQINKHYNQLLTVNAQFIRARIRKQFLEHIELCYKSPSVLNDKEIAFKKAYNDGRKILENEFNKKMRYKSIRELAALESGLIIKDLKPVWLMSPLSVSDSLPVDINYFDVVIFDEASQITLEQGIPAIFRANKTIVVGDEMQMPPTNFFNAKTEDVDDLDGDNSESNETLSIDADSLLTQGARKLPSYLLGWHYRSKYETLISYSNHAFYNKNLLTIPDKTVGYKKKEAIVVAQPSEAANHIDELQNRSISYHYLENSIYEKRTNKNEADYIAELVRAILKKGSGESIGIVAFSQDQQNTIEDALVELAMKDADFEKLLEIEYEKEEEGQFIGLFVKNLENVQGDERDIIIMSVCYGKNRSGKMLMNFGPINKKGGEKRLNVIFSRAKKHMAIISSIKHNQITNEYNEGANYFKRFLHYAEAVSAGDMELANIILGKLVNKPEDLFSTEEQVELDVAKQIKAALEAKGYFVDHNIGQSSFTCTLGVKQNESDQNFELGILIDDDYHYSTNNIMELYYQRPYILKNFGWRVLQILIKDWLDYPEKVIDRIIRQLQQPNEVEAIPKIKEEIDFIQSNQVVSDSSKSISSKSIKADPYAHLQFKRYEFKDERSNKFWEYTTNESKLILRYGRIGSRGQIRVKTFDTIEKCNKEISKLVDEKLGKGYVGIECN